MSYLRLLALATTLLALLYAGLSAKEQYFCRMSERVVDSCCCSPACPPGVARSGPAVERAECCVRVRGAALPVSASRQEAAPALAVLALPPKP